MTLMIKGLLKFNMYVCLGLIYTASAFASASKSCETYLIENMSDEYDVVHETVIYNGEEHQLPWMAVSPLFIFLIKNPYYSIDVEEAYKLMGEKFHEEYFEVSNPDNLLMNRLKVYIKKLPAALTENGGIFERSAFKVFRGRVSFYSKNPSLEYLASLSDTKNINDTLIVSSIHGFAFYKGRPLATQGLRYLGLIEQWMSVHPRQYSLERGMNYMNVHSRNEYFVHVHTIKKFFKNVDSEFDSIKTNNGHYFDFN